MEVLLVDIPDSGLTLKATRNDKWLCEALSEALGECFSKDDEATLTLRFLRFEDNVNVDGEVEFTTHRSCDRCLTDFVKVQVVPLKSVLIPKFNSRRDERESQGEGLDDDIIDGDVEFGTYEGDRIDISDFVRDAVVLSLPMKVLCKETCKGLCYKCGNNLNLEPCKCETKEMDPRWNALKGIKLEAKMPVERAKPKPKTKRAMPAPKKPKAKTPSLKAKQASKKTKSAGQKPKKAR